MKTERTKELLERFKDHGISHDPNNGLNYVLEYQDCIGHATQKEIYEFYEGLDQRKRELFCWSNMNCLSYDMAVDILKRTVIASYKSREEKGLMEYFEKGHKELDAKKATFDKCRKHAHKKIGELRKENMELQGRLHQARIQNGELHKLHWETCKIANEYKTLAEKYNALKRALA